MPAESDADSGLRFSFVDVEGGAATLIVTPAGESILIDSGNPGDRDAGRIAQAARQMGITEIDHYITTHWHSDHVGGIGPLSKLIPVRATYGHRLPEPLPEDINAELVAAWKAVSATPTFLAAGDSISLRGKRGTPTPKLRVLAANGLVDGEKDGAPPIIKCEKGHEAQPEDTSDNARSLVLHLNYGDFDLLAGGDLTWNIEHKLVCPRRIVSEGRRVPGEPSRGRHQQQPGAGRSPRAGSRHRQQRPPQRRRAQDDGALDHAVARRRRVPVASQRQARRGQHRAGRIANVDEACKAQLIGLRVEPHGGRFVVSIPSRSVDRAFSAK